MRAVSDAMHLCTQSRSNSLIINMISEIADLDPKLKTWAVGLKIPMRLIFMKFGTQNKSNMLIMNIVLGIDVLDPKLSTQANLVPTLKCAPTFMKFGTHNKSNMLIMNIILASVSSARVIIGSECL